MKLIGVAGVVWFMLSSLVVGTRLLALARRTRQLPELLLALALWFTGVLGFALPMAAKLLAGPSTVYRVWLPVSGLCFEYLGSGAVMLFSWRVFHKRDRWAAALAGVLGAIVIAALLGELTSGQFMRYRDGLPSEGPFIPMGLLARAVGPAWVSIESFRHYAMARRRMRLGLAEPLVVNRFALWGMAMSATVAGYLLTVVHRLVFHTGILTHEWALNSVSALAFVAAVGIGLAFFPPAAYRRWVDRSRTAG